MNYDTIIKQLKVEGNPTPTPRLTFAIPNARDELMAALEATSRSMNEQFVWLPEYDLVAQWLSGNNGKGLLLYGVCGRGKSIMVRYVIPMIFRSKLNRIITVVDCGDQGVRIDDVTKRKFIGLDDIGVESDRVEYGTRRNLVAEIFNKVQDTADAMVIASTNLSPEALKERYGDRILDRIKYLCVRVPFNGESLRK